MINYYFGDFRKEIETIASETGRKPVNVYDGYADRILHDIYFSRYISLKDCYTKHSEAKEFAQNEVSHIATRINAKYYKILRFNTFSFTVGMLVELPANHCIVVHVTKNYIYYSNPILNTFETPNN